MKIKTAKKMMALLLAAGIFGLTACAGSTAAQDNQKAEETDVAGDTSSQEGEDKTAVVEADKSGEGEIVTLGIWSEDEKKDWRLLLQTAKKKSELR